MSDIKRINPDDFPPVCYDCRLEDAVIDDEVCVQEGQDFVPMTIWLCEGCAENAGISFSDDVPYPPY